MYSYIVAFGLGLRYFHIYTALYYYVKIQFKLIAFKDFTNKADSYFNLYLILQVVLLLALRLL